MNIGKSHLICTAFMLATVFTVDLCAQRWIKLGEGQLANISGMALVSRENRVKKLIVVHDNKKKAQLRASIVTLTDGQSPIITSLKWLSDDLPIDLEAVTAIPERSGEFIVFASAGRVYYIRVDVNAATVDVIRSFEVPMIPKGADFEAFAVQKIGGKLIALWADRGASERPAILFWANLDLTKRSFSNVGSTTFRVPFPQNDVRHISDLKIDPTGAIFVTSASDPGDDGAYSSAAYNAGSITVDRDKINFTQTPVLTPLFRFQANKVEALELIPGSDGGMIFGTDDENLGAGLFLP